MKFQNNYILKQYVVSLSTALFFAQYEFSVIFDTSHLTGQEETLTFLVTAQR